ncbi:MAG: transcription elongation factor GreA [Solirubrobacterales bacterium]
MSNSGSELTGEPITPKGLEELEAEIAELEGPGRHEMAERIKSARELGDLKENAEYHIAKDDQAHLETRIKRLRGKLRGAVVVEATAGSETFAFGTSAEVLETESGKLHKWTLVGSTEADVAEGRISADSPVGTALRDSRVGDDVVVETPGGERLYRVQKLLG